jgi:hypothetical protein
MDTREVGTAPSINWRNFSASSCRSKQRRKINTEQVAQKVALYDKDIVSVEARTMDGSSPETRGIDGVRGKVDWWLENMQVHGFKADGPFVAHDRFVVQYDADVTDKNSKKRMQLSEVGV